MMQSNAMVTTSKTALDGVAWIMNSEQHWELAALRWFPEAFLICIELHRLILRASRFAVFSFIKLSSEPVSIKAVAIPLGKKIFVANSPLLVSGLTMRFDSN